MTKDRFCFVTQPESRLRSASLHEIPKPNIVNILDEKSVDTLFEK